MLGFQSQRERELANASSIGNKLSYFLYYTDMSEALPMANVDKEPNHEPERRWRWVLPLAGLLLALAFPNELLPGLAHLFAWSPPVAAGLTWWGDHPSPLLAWVAIFPLLWYAHKLPVRQALRGAFLFGFVWQFCSVAWLRLFGEGVLMLLPWVLLALFMALLPWITVLIARAPRLPARLFPLVFAVIWTGLEWLRGQGMFGFAWTELGTTQVEGPLAFVAALGGVPLISFLMLWLLGEAINYWRVTQKPWLLAAAALAFLLCSQLGAWQIRMAVARWQGEKSGQTVTLVQPSLLKDLSPDVFRHPIPDVEAYRRLLTLVEMSQRDATPGQQRLIIWPESALLSDPASVVFNGITNQQIIGQTARVTDSYLLVGAPHIFWQPGSSPPIRRNGAFLFAPAGRIVAEYDKIHLVPFGEYVPGRAVISKLFTVRPNDITSGPEHKIINDTGHPFGTAICFESTFSDISREYASKGARMLVIITNDAWFQRTNAVRLHFNHARFRAIENGLPVARTASCGISAFIAPDGRILGDEIPVYATGTRTAFIPDGTPGTLFTRVGWMFGPLCALLMLLYIGVWGWQRMRGHS